MMHTGLSGFSVEFAKCLWKNPLRLLRWATPHSNLPHHRGDNMKSLLAITAITLAASVPSHAQQKPGPIAGTNYPSKAVRIIVNSSPGGSTDIFARLLSKPFTERFGQPFIVDNIAGASGMIGFIAGAKAAPDGHTLAMGTGNTTNNAAIIAKVPFDVRKAYASIGQITTSANVLIVSTALPVKDVNELIAHIKKQPPGKLNFASGGIGSASHLCSELLVMMAGLSMVHVPYKGVTPGIQDVVAGRGEFIFATSSAAFAMMKAGRAKLLGIAAPARFPSLPDVPAIAEFIPGYEYTGWIGLQVTGGTPRPIIVGLNQELNAALKAPEVMKVLTADGSNVTPGTPEDLQRVVEKSLDMAEQLVKKLNLKLD
jgi:tripartite-type tricarboxylate transporter receptor subunit TctC